MSEDPGVCTLLLGSGEPCLSAGKVFAHLSHALNACALLLSRGASVFPTPDKPAGDFADILRSFWGHMQNC